MKRKKTVLLKILLLAVVLFPGLHARSSNPDILNRKDTAQEKIWLQVAYFTDLYKADYKGALALVHDNFLGWPGALQQPIVKKESHRYMKQLVPKPTSCVVRIERDGMRLMGTVALTQFRVFVSCRDTTGAMKTSSSRITHTWVKEDGKWKLLGGMSNDN